jgi:hypothetical protein
MLFIKHHIMKRCGSVEDYLHVFLTSELPEDEWSVSQFCRFAETGCRTRPVLYTDRAAPAAVRGTTPRKLFLRERKM